MAKSRVTIHMAASLDGYIARRDGRVDWMATTDDFPEGLMMTSDFVDAFLKTIDCYVMGARTYEMAIDFESKGLGWAYGEKPTLVLTTRALRRSRESVEFYSGDLAALINERLRLKYQRIWVAGGRELVGECLRLGLADEISYAILPVLIGDGISFFDTLAKDIPLHLADVKAYRSGMVELRYELRAS